MKADDRHNEIYCLIEVGHNVCDRDSRTLARYLSNGYVFFPSQEMAEEGRKNGAAYDEPGRTRVVGFRVAPFIPKKKQIKKGVV